MRPAIPMHYFALVPPFKLRPAQVATIPGVRIIAAPGGAGDCAKVWVL
jgi:hypothetical protein